MRSEWRKCELGDVLTLKRGYDLPTKEREEGHVPIVSSSGITGTHNKAKVRGPGVVTGRYGTLGEVFFVEGDFWPLNTALYVQDFKGNAPRFISYFLRTLPLSDQNAAGAVPGLNRNALHQMEVTCPPVSEQRRIAQALSAYDNLIENNTRRIDILEQMAQAIYREWFVNFRFPGHEEVEMVESELGPIPEGWEAVAFSEVVEINPRLKFDKTRERPYVPMGEVSETSFLVAPLECRTGRGGSRFQNGDSLFARINPSLQNGKTAFVQFLASDGDVAIGSTEFIVFRSRSLCPELVQLMARSPQVREPAIKSMVGASGRQRVQLDIFDQILVPQAQQSVIDHFQSTVGPMFELAWSLGSQNRVLRETRDLLLPKLVSGEISVEDLNSTLEGVVA